MNTETIKLKIIEWGANLVGFGDMDGFLPEKLNRFQNAISIAVRLSDSIMDEVVEGPTLEYAYHHHVVNALLNEIALKTANLIQSLGYRAHPLPVSQTINQEELEAAFPHKTAATRAGLGWIGKNALLVTPEFGPRLRLVTVLSDYSFEPGHPIEKSRCGDCLECVNICPLKAIKGGDWQAGVKREELVDAFSCNGLIEKNKGIFNAPLCGRCLSVCPAGEKRVLKR
jgi:epoxyqueuosine reductase